MKIVCGEGKYVSGDGYLIDLFLTILPAQVFPQVVVGSRYLAHVFPKVMLILFEMIVGATCVFPI
jgi:hypothetical protein